jgi:hypothetical protein
MSRWILFLITIALGFAAGLFYGWKINPVNRENTTADSLREDYKADYVLMVAEAYQAEGDLNSAIDRLSALGSQPPAEIVSNAIQFAATIQPPYAESALVLMRKLADDLRTPIPATEMQTP